MKQQKMSSVPGSLLKSGLCALSVSVAGLFVAGCDSGSSGGSSAPATDAAHIAGNVQDIHGPLMEGKVEVRDNGGRVVTTVTLNGSSNHYSVDVPAGDGVRLRPDPPTPSS